MQSLGGRMMSESSHAPGGLAEKLAVKHIVTKLTTRPTPRLTRNLSVYLAETPFGTSSNNIQLENSTSGEFESGAIVLDAHAPLSEGVVPINLESPTSRIVLNGTDSSSSNADSALLPEEGDVIVSEETETDTGVKDRLLLELGGIVMAESDRFSFPLGFVVDENENLILEDHHSDAETISFNDIGDLRFEDILKPNKLILEQGENTDSDFHFSQVILLEDDVDGNAEKNQLLLEETGRFQLFENEFTKLLGSGVADQDNANAVENTGILLENFGQILLDASDNSGTDAGHYLVQETTKNNRFNLERSGSIVTEDFDTSSVVERLVTEMNDGDNFILEELPAEVPIAILLENEGENDVLVLSLIHI